VLIEEYFLRLDRVLASYPQIERMTITKEKRAPHIGLVKGEIVFAGGLQLFLMEFIRTEPHLIKTKYRYHCQDMAGAALFRYDNAPHHHTDTFPNHKHTFAAVGEIISAAHPPSIEALLDEVAQYGAAG